MAWENGRYYTRSVKVADRVIREYYGCGLVGQLAAEEDGRRQQEREKQRAGVRQEFDEIAALDGPANALEADVERLFRLAMHAAGYVQHARGEWRRRRG